MKRYLFYLVWLGATLLLGYLKFKIHPHWALLTTPFALWILIKSKIPSALAEAYFQALMLITVAAFLTGVGLLMGFIPHLFHSFAIILLGLISLASLVSLRSLLSKELGLTKKQDKQK